MTNNVETLTVQTVATMSTRSESKQCGWLQTVSNCTTMQKHNDVTYLPVLPETSIKQLLGRGIDSNLSGVVVSMCGVDG